MPTMDLTIEASPLINQNIVSNELYTLMVHLLFAGVNRIFTTRG